ncbi:GBF-interacting protein 1, N-terminal [Dillenia turbinata]|uniref:GBF-interacting protein 1, N-terminal n=1 Tax=Dillenia turbinata TaxID=194707 RepID=A0AAN8UNC9_9MAGN
MNSSSGARVSIPSSVRKTIQNIKEITGNHSDDEIYAMLKECSMDPNETTQKLLLQDTFHEVKRKRGKRKENVNSKEAAESRWRSGTGRVSRGARGNFSAHHVTHGDVVNLFFNSATFLGAKCFVGSLLDKLLFDQALLAGAEMRL